jgi:hypothetical protein
LCAFDEMLSTFCGDDFHNLRLTPVILLPENHTVKASSKEDSMKGVVSLFVIVLLMGSRVMAQDQPAPAPADPQVVQAVDGLLSAFETHDVVAIGEQHGIAELGNLYQSLLRDPRFAEVVDAVVLEYGNARYQDLVDRYMNGEDVPYEELRQVWNDAVGRVPGGTEVMYVQLYATLRAINQTLPEGERIRVLLGDPPIDWGRVNTREDALPYQLSRESHFAEVVIQEVLDKGLKALVIIGAPHLDRSEPRDIPAPPTNPASDVQAMIPTQTGIMQQIVEAAYPGVTFVAVVHTGFVEDECNAEIEARMAGWQQPMLAYVRGTWIEQISCTKFPAPIFIMPGTAGQGDQIMGAPNMQPLDGNTPPPAMPSAPSIPSMIAQADAYLYVGNRDDLTMSPFDPASYLDMDYFSEMSRRHEIMMGTPLEWSRVAQDNPYRYVDNFPAQQ